MGEEDEDNGMQPPSINAWLGPEGTVTPLHYDPDHNLLAQVGPLHHNLDAQGDPFHQDTVHNLL